MVPELLTKWYTLGRSLAWSRSPSPLPSRARWATAREPSRVGDQRRARLAGKKAGQAPKAARPIVKSEPFAGFFSIA